MYQSQKKTFIQHSFNKFSAISNLIRAKYLFKTLPILLMIAIVLSLSQGAYKLHASDWKAIVLLGKDAGIPFEIIFSIRAPRVLLAVLTGAVFGAVGTALQALFRNPLADPSLIGVTSGAASGAALAIVLTPYFLGTVITVPLAAFIGSLTVVGLLYRLASGQGKPTTTLMLLAGIAINALAGALIGALSYLADDAALRTLTFWNLGSFASASWNDIAWISPVVILPLIVLLKSAPALNLIQIGEREAIHLGVRTITLTRVILICSALAVGALIASTGIIGFIGLVAPHCVRLVYGPDCKQVMPKAMWLGALLAIAADLAARLIIAPVELPLGIFTALIGAPFFLVLLFQQKTID